MNYYDQVNAELQPQYRSAMDQIKARMADQGLSHSTAAQGLYARTQGDYLANVQREAYNRQQADRDRAMRLYDMMYSAAWNRQQYDKNHLAKFPNAPTAWNKDIYRNLWGTDNVGDPVEQQVEDKSGAVVFHGINDYANAQQALQNSLAQRAQSLSERRFAFDKAQAEKETADDPYQTLASIVAAPGELAGQPSKILALFQASSGVNMMEKAHEGDPRAIRLIQSLYPASWAEQIANYHINNPAFTGGGYSLRPNSTTTVTDDGRGYNDFFNAPDPAAQAAAESRGEPPSFANFGNSVLRFFNRGF